MDHMHGPPLRYVKVNGAFMRQHSRYVEVNRAFPSAGGFGRADFPGTITDHEDGFWHQAHVALAEARALCGSCTSRDQVAARASVHDN